MLSTEMKNYMNGLCDGRNGTSSNDKKACKEVVKRYPTAKDTSDFALKAAFDAIIFLERNIFDKAD